MIVTSSTGSKSSRNCIYAGRVNRSPSRPMLWFPNLKGGNLPEAFVKEQKDDVQYINVLCAERIHRKNVLPLQGIMTDKSGFMERTIYQTLLLFTLMAFMPPLLSGCRNNGKAEEKNSQTELVEQKKPIFMKESFHKFRESMDGSISPQWLLSDSLSKYATIEEIEKLATTDKDPIKRLVAFRALLSKDPQHAVNLAISNIEDTTIVGTTDGICGEQDRVSNIRILMLQNHRERNHITYKDSVRVDSAALFSTNFPLYGYSQWLYHNMPAKPEYETRLRQLYKQDPRALVTLAKYHREKERLEIIQLLSNTKNEDDRNYCDTLRAVLNAVANWPDASFIPFVQKVCQKIIMERQYTFGCEESAFRALIAYHSKWSYDMAEKALAKAKKDENKFMVCWGFHEAFEHNPQPLFKPLITKYPIN